jgi:TPR repeat protein
LGEIYFKVEYPGISPNLEEAEKWYIKASYKNDGALLFTILGQIYYNHHRKYTQGFKLD